MVIHEGDTNNDNFYEMSRKSESIRLAQKLDSFLQEEPDNYQDAQGEITILADREYFAIPQQIQTLTRKNSEELGRARTFVSAGGKIAVEITKANEIESTDYSESGPFFDLPEDFEFGFPAFAITQTHQVLNKVIDTPYGPLPEVVQGPNDLLYKFSNVLFFNLDGESMKLQIATGLWNIDEDGEIDNPTSLDDLEKMGIDASRIQKVDFDLEEGEKIAEVTDEDLEWVDKITGHIKTPAFTEEDYIKY